MLYDGCGDLAHPFGSSIMDKLQEKFKAGGIKIPQKKSGLSNKLGRDFFTLQRLGYPVTLGLGVSLILISVRKEFDGFVQNYNMHSLGKTITELHAILKKGLRASRKLKLGDLSLYVGNGQREAVEAIGVFYLCLPSGLEIVLNNWHYASSITRGDILRGGIFEIDLSNSYANDISMYAISNKRAKLDLDSALLWHCRLGYISKKRIMKLQHDGLLNSTDLRAFEKYVSCMSGKMASKPYTNQVERAKDLFGQIHTDVCGPFNIISRQGASYFVTFTNDFSCYGYVYLLKHKMKCLKLLTYFKRK
nr:hypothetical protein [Tanacetum cinerariifolium]